jgi:3-hydroxyisobutyrate dehydrogenase-like beta-hydroxyacid dehydrogenase
MSVGIIGSGPIVVKLASALRQRGHALRLHAKRGASALLALPGDQVVPTPAAAVPSGGVVISSLDDDDELAEAALGPEGILSALGPNGLHVCMGQAAPQTARALSDRHAELGSQFVMAAFLERRGTSDTLVLVQGGHRGGKARLGALLAGGVDGPIDLGDDPAAVCVVGLTARVVEAALVQSLAEATAIASRYGVAPQLVADVAASCDLDGPALRRALGAVALAHGVGPDRADADRALAAPLRGVTLARDIAVGAGVPSPLIGLLADRVARAVATGQATEELAALARFVLADAGLGSGRGASGD